MQNSPDGIEMSFVLHCINTYDSLNGFSLEFIGVSISMEIHMSMKREVKLNAITIFPMCVQCVCHFFHVRKFVVGDFN